MLKVVDLILRTGGTVLGALCLYTAFFLYEDEEGRLKNSLDQLWIRVADRSDSASIAIRRLAEESCRLTSQALDRIFGREYLSPRAIGVSFFYGAASIAAYPIYLYSGSVTLTALWAIPLIFFVLGSLPALHNNKFTTRVVFLPTVAFVSFFLLATVQLGFLIGDGSSTEIELFAVCASVATALIIAIACDFGWIVLFRRTFIWVTSGQSLRRMASLILINSVALAFGLLPVYWTGLFEQFRSTEPFSLFLMTFIFLLIMSRLFVMATALLFLSVLVTILLHRLLWPIVDRSVYSLVRHDLIQNRKLLGTIGLALIMACTWESAFLSRIAHFVRLD